MRVRVFFGILGLCVMLATLIGCNDNELASQASIRGTITAGGQAQSGSTVTLLQNGVAVGSPTTSGSTGEFTLRNVAAGKYTLRITNGLVTTFTGPITVTNAGISNLNITGASSTTLPSGVSMPTNGTATVVAFGVDQNNTPVNVTVQVDENTPSGNGNPAVLTGVAPVTEVVRVRRVGTTEQVSFTNVPLAANSVTIFRVNFTGQVFGISGKVTNIQNTATANTNVELFMNGVSAGLATTADANGNFNFTNIAPGTYTLLATGPGADNVATFFGPFTVSNQNVQNLALVQPLRTELPATVAPTATAGTLVVYAVDNQGNMETANVQIGANTPVQGASNQPVVINSVSPGVFTVSVVVDNRTITVPGVVFVANAVTALRVVTD